MRLRRVLSMKALIIALLAMPAVANAADPSCEAEPSPACFGIESANASLSTQQAGAHPDFNLEVEVKQDPTSPPNVFGLHDSYAATREIRFNIPPGMIGDPNALGPNQQCTAQQLTASECPNASQVGTAEVTAYEVTRELHEPIYMMIPPGGEIAGRLGTIAGIFPIFIDFHVRSESDYGLTAEVHNSPTAARLIKLDNTLWGVPADPVHDTDRCTPNEALGGCVVSPSRPPGSAEKPFLTNPTRCGVPLSLGVNASSWAEPELLPENEVQATLPPITGCDRLPFGPSLDVQPTIHSPAAPSGLDMTLKLPASTGVDVLEPSQIRYMRIDLPKGVAINTASVDGLGTCSPQDVGFERNVAAACPDSAKLAATEFAVPLLERNLRGAIYLREPEPGHPYRVWIVADDLGLHLKLPGDLELDRDTGQIHSVTVGTPQLEGLPQAPLREVKLLFKSGFRAPLVTPPSCGTYLTHYEFVPWAGGPPKVSEAPMVIDQGCDGRGSFSPGLAAGSTDATGGSFSPFTIMITREDDEQNLAGLSVALPRGLAASFAGIPRCEGQAAQTGACPPDSRVGKVVAAVGAGPAPLWVPQPGKRPSAVYLGGPYKGAPLSIVSVVPKQAGPFDFGDEVVKSAVYVDPVTAQATVQADPLPQFVEGTPLFYRTINVQVDRPGFSLNPTSCARKETVAELVSTLGAKARPIAPYAATDCARLDFEPRLSFRLSGGTHRGAHPSLKATIRPRPGDANIGAFSIALPRSEFLDQAHIKTVCTRVQFAADACPPGAIYGKVRATSPLFDFPLEGNIYLRSSSNPLPDMVAALRGPASMPIEVDSAGRIDSINGGIRTTFDTVPDAPITKVVASFPGGSKGLLVNSRNLCRGTHRVTAKFTAQNGRRANLHPVLKAPCRS